jgi:WD40 repeat protein
LAAEAEASPAGAAPATAGGEAFDLFISYSTLTDYALARDLERFLSRFHQLPGIGKHGLAPLRVCVDGSSFLQRRRGQVRTVAEVVRDHLARSRQMLVLCSSGAARSAAVAAEVQDFLDRGRAGAIQLAVTEGAEPAVRPQEIFPAPVLAAGLERTIWFDLRGYRGRAARSWPKVRDLGRERVRLAAEVLAAVGKSQDLTADDLYPDWLEQERKAAGRRLRRVWSVAGGMVVLTVAATALGLIADAQRKRVAVLHDLSEVRREAAEARAVVDLEPERGLRGSAQAWDDLQPLARARSMPALETDLARARFDALQALFATLSRHRGLLGPLGGPRLEPLLAASRKGDLLVIADGTAGGSWLELWRLRGEDLEPGGRVALPGRVLCVTVAASGRQLLAASRRFVRVWDLEAGGAVSKERTIDLADAAHPELYCASAALDPAGERAWLGTNEGALYELELATGRLQPLPGGSVRGIINDLAVSPAGDQLFVAAWTASRGLSSFALGRRNAAPVRFAGVDAPARSLALSDDGMRLFSGHEDGTVAAWEAGSGRLLAAERVSGASVVAIIALAGGRELVAANEAGELIAVDTTKTVEMKARTRLFGGPVIALAPGPDGSAIGASPQANVRRWRAGAPSPLETVLAVRTEASLGVNFAPQGAVLTAFGVSQVARWAMGGRGFVPQPALGLTLPAGFEIGAVAPGGRLAALVPPYGGSDHRLRLASPGPAMPTVLRGLETTIARVAFSPSGRRLAAAGTERPMRICIWSTATPAAMPTILGDREGALVSDLAFSPDERQLAASDLSRCARIWTIETRKAASAICRPDDEPGPQAWNPRTGAFAVGWLSGRISIHATADGRAPQRWLVRHGASIRALGFDPSGRWLVSASGDGAVLWWDAATWNVVGEMQDPDRSFVRALAVSPDGASLATLGQGGSRLSVWSLDPAEWARRARRLAGAPPAAGSRSR